MDIQDLEINLCKASEIKDGDVILVKIDPEDRKKFKKEEVENLYKRIKMMTKKENISIYFFPKNASIELVKKNISSFEESKDKMIENIKEK